MQEPIYVTKVAERETSYPERHVVLPLDQPPDDFEKRLEWQRKNSWKIEYSVHKSNFEEAKILAKRLHENISKEEEEGVIKRLLDLRSKKWEEKTEKEKWEHMAVQLPGDWGPVTENRKKELKKIVTEIFYGRVLEAMCGFRSYIDESPQITEVVALDFCEEALERYDYPKRKRILYNLEDIIKGDRMEFFRDESFQTVGVFFAIDYLTDPIPVHKEFHRILSNDGQLLIVGGTEQGYRDILKRKFNPVECSKSMQSAGFSTVFELLPTIKTDSERGDYYLVQGKKARRYG